ncbi:MAG: DUF1295 domain-containing protein [Spirochaetia bacterium]|nr:DUF1295 domain-containing protein [Spirochaetia bacterium]
MQNKNHFALTDKAYISGLVGALIVILAGYIYSKESLFQNSSAFFVKTDMTAFHVLLFCAFSMFIIELITRKKTEKTIFVLSAKIKNRKYLSFIKECVLQYLLELIILFTAVFFYRSASEYGFAAKKGYYKPWFNVMDVIVNAYLYFGFFYVAFTRAFQSGQKADKKEPSFLLLKTIYLFFQNIMVRLSIKSRPLETLKKYLRTIYEDSEKYEEKDKYVVLGVFVKLFFIPVMTVFFFDQFKHLVNNWGFLTERFGAFFAGRRDTLMSIRDFHNVSFSFIFSIDVGVAWCGYVFSSRWIKNSYTSVEPTFFGWAVALLCYPPFRVFLGFYFPVPAEKAFFSISSAWVVTLLALLSVISYLIYMAATLVFGLRFSNLTNRGIIRTGPYAYIRHPAYAAKNLSWWLVMLPSVLYAAYTKENLTLILQVFGLIIMSSLYYFRAITEEKHLLKDEAYVQYCKKVKYRFIPRIL